MHQWKRDATVGGRTIPEQPDLRRMRAERHARLQEELARQDLDGLVLLGSTAVSYAAGLAVPAEDSGRSGIFRPVVVVAKGERAPHVYTMARDGLPPSFRRTTPTDRFSPTSRTGRTSWSGPCRITFPPARGWPSTTRPTRCCDDWERTRGATGGRRWPRRSCARPPTRSPASEKRSASRSSPWSTPGERFGPECDRAT